MADSDGLAIAPQKDHSSPVTLGKPRCAYNAKPAIIPGHVVSAVQYGPVQYKFRTANHLYHPQKPKLGSHFTSSSPAILSHEPRLPTLSRVQNAMLSCRIIICLSTFAIEELLGSSRSLVHALRCYLAAFQHFFGTPALEELWS